MTYSNGYKPQGGHSRGFAAVFIDFENIYYYLKENYADLPDLNDYLFDMLRNLQRHLERRLGLQCIIMKAYADFERLKSAPQGSLYLMGVETHNVLGTDHKNTADMKLCIDALEVLYTRPEIESFIFLAGDRDYIPVIQHLKKQARSVFAVAFRGNISGDLLLNVGPQNFIDAVTLIDPEMMKRLEMSARRQREIEAAERKRDEQRTAELVRREALLEESAARDESAELPERDDEYSEEGYDDDDLMIDDGDVLSPPAPTQSFNSLVPILGDTERLCLEVLLKNYGRHPEVWMSPFLRKLSDALPRLADFERKALLTTLEAAGAIRIEKRRGEPYDYSIILVNYNHPTVRELVGP
ncbi:MAG: hypothetical protein JWQ98_3278 [Chlorobi bacterium]|nr:hypothetical protein [Chlorobiota bacterium]